MSLLTTYLTTLAALRASGGAVAETSYYPPLAGLLDTVGATLSPTVRCVGQLKNFLAAGSPDFGLYSADQFPRKADLGQPPAGLLPARGVLEVKGTGDEVDAVAASPQVAKYLKAFGLVLVTNYRDFLLVTRGPDATAQPGERYRLAPDDAMFKALRADGLADSTIPSIICGQVRAQFFRLFDCNASK